MSHLGLYFLEVDSRSNVPTNTFIENREHIPLYYNYYTFVVV
jgi:hypothetical protein